MFGSLSDLYAHNRLNYRKVSTKVKLPDGSFAQTSDLNSFQQECRDVRSAAEDLNLNDKSVSLTLTLQSRSRQEDPEQARLKQKAKEVSIYRTDHLEIYQYSNTLYNIFYQEIRFWTEI